MEKHNDIIVNSYLFNRIKWYNLRKKITRFNISYKSNLDIKDVAFFDVIKKVLTKNDTTILSPYDDEKIIKNVNLNVEIFIDCDSITIFDGESEKVNLINNKIMLIINNYINKSIRRKIFIEKRKKYNIITQSVHKLQSCLDYQEK